jgi:hypothetical protein
MSTQKKMVITPELKARLAGFLGFTKDPVFFYVPEIFREKNDKGDFIIPRENWPVFKLKGKTGIESAEDEDDVGTVDFVNRQMYMKVGHQRINLLSKHILGWKNFLDIKGEEIEFKTVDGVLDIEALSRVQVPLQKELKTVINNQSHLTSEEVQGLEF